MKLFKLTLIFLTLLIISACSSNKTQIHNDITQENIITSASNGATLSIKPVIYTKNLELRDTVKKECQLLTKLPTFIKNYAAKQYGTINLESKNSKSGDFLVLEISGISNAKKNIWTGQGVGQWVTVKGTLLRNGKNIASFKANRATTGGFMGGYKGTCALLGRCTKTLGKDIAAWLKKPVNNAQLGDL